MYICVCMYELFQNFVDFGVCGFKQICTIETFDIDRLHKFLLYLYTSKNKTSFSIHLLIYFLSSCTSNL